MSIRVRNWRDQAPYVGHISALVWTLFQSHDKDETSPPGINRLHGINSFVKHGLQGHQHSDHHRHDAIEQLYFILRGRGQLLIGDDKVDVRDGTAVYMPVNVPHQAFNDGDGWMEHLIVSCPLDEIREGTPAVRDWRDVHPVVLEGGTVSWPLLRREEEARAGEGGVLQRVHGVTRYAVQGRHGTAWQQLDGIELVHYVLSGFGIVEDLDGDRQQVTEGSAAHVLPGVAHRFSNEGEGWLEYVTFAVEIGEVEAPDEPDEFEEPAEQHGVEDVVAAAVVAEFDWDDADAVETEEEIEEDGADDDVESAQTEDEVAEEEADDEAMAVDVAEEEADDEAMAVDVAEEDTESIEAEDEAVADDGVGEDSESSVAEWDVESAQADDEVSDGEDDTESDDLESEEVEADDTVVTVDDEDGEAQVAADTGAEDAVDAEDVVEEVEDTEVTEDAEEEEDDVDEANQDDADDADDANQASARAEADDDDFYLDDDDADFGIEDDDETVVEDETGEDDDDSPDADRR